MMFVLQNYVKIKFNRLHKSFSYFFMNLFFQDFKQTLSIQNNTIIILLKLIPNFFTNFFNSFCIIFKKIKDRDEHFNLLKHLLKVVRVLKCLEEN